MSVPRPGEDKTGTLVETGNPGSHAPGQGPSASDPCRRRETAKGFFPPIRGASRQTVRAGPGSSPRLLPQARNLHRTRHNRSLHRPAA